MTRALRIIEAAGAPDLARFIWHQALLSIVSINAEALFPRAPITPAARTRLLAALDALDRPDRLARATYQEVRSFLAYYPLDCTGIARAEEAIALSSGKNESDAQRLTLFRRFPPPVRRAILARDRVELVRTGTELMELYARSLSEAREGHQRIAARVAGLDPASAPLTCTQWDDPLVFIEVAGRAAAYRSLLRLAVMLSESRVLPSALPVAVPDPCGPGSIRWRRIDARHGVLWSVGTDGQDDGAIRPAPGESRLPGRDIVLTVRLP